MHASDLQVKGIRLRAQQARTSRQGSPSPGSLPYRDGVSRGGKMPEERDISLDHLPKQVREIVEETRRYKAEIRQSQQQEDKPRSPEENELTPAGGEFEPRKEPEPKPTEADEWKRKHDALYGKYSTEIGQARGQIRAMQAELETLRADLQAAKEAGKHEPEKGQEKAERIDPKAFDEYDDAFKKLAATVARLEDERDALKQQIGSMNGQLQKQVESRIEPIEASVKQRKYDDFLLELRSKVPHLGEQNADPDFVSWLNTPNPYDPTGGSYGDTLRAAESRFNADAVARIFLDFAAQSGKYAPEKPAQPATPRPKNVQPSTTPSAPAQTDKGPRVWSEAEIGQFYNDIAQGKYAGRDDEVRAKKRAIFEAGQKGLVV